MCDLVDKAETTSPLCTQNNIDGMLSTLLPLHEMMQPLGRTTSEAAAYLDQSSVPPSIRCAICFLEPHPCLHCLTRAEIISNCTSACQLGAITPRVPYRRDVVSRGPTTPMELSFVQQYGQDLNEAHQWCLKYTQSKKESDLHQASQTLGCVGDLAALGRLTSREGGRGCHVGREQQGVPETAHD